MERITVFGRFETMSQETNQILKEVGAVICDLKKIDDDRCSIASSKYSRKSGRSKSSRHSTMSTISSPRQRRLDLEEELALARISKAKMSMVKVKVKVEIEREEKRVREQIEMATEKYEISKELAEKKARINACKRFEEEVGMPDFGDNDQISIDEHIN